MATFRRSIFGFMSLATVSTFCTARLYRSTFTSVIGMAYTTIFLLFRFGSGILWIAMVNTFAYHYEKSLLITENILLQHIN
ncbi:MAG: hypothetical protein H6584_08515 [Flavobacteriales bacterium]|nr:hypothetical protein [Flavobacteriales bacterium]